MDRIAYFLHMVQAVLEKHILFRVGCHFTDNGDMLVFKFTYLT
jgi:hypothetical protein